MPLRRCACSPPIWTASPTPGQTYRMRPIPRQTEPVGAPLVGALTPLCLPLRSWAYPSFPAFLPHSRLQTMPGVTPTEPVGAPLVGALTPLRVLTPNLDCVPYARANPSNAPNPPSDRTRRGAPCGRPSPLVRTRTLALLGIPFMSSLSAPFPAAAHAPWRHPDRTRRGRPLWVPLRRCACSPPIWTASPTAGQTHRMRPIPRQTVPVRAPLVGALRPLCLPLRSWAYPSFPAFLPHSRLQTMPGVTPTEPVGAPLVGALTPLRVLTPNLDCVPYARANTSNAPNPPSDRTRRGAPCGRPSPLVRTRTLALLGIPFMSSLSAPFPAAAHTWRHPDRTRRGAPCGCPSPLVRALALLRVLFSAADHTWVTRTEPAGAPLVGALTPLRVLTLILDSTQPEQRFANSSTA